MFGGNLVRCGTLWDFTVALFRHFDATVHCAAANIEYRYILASREDAPERGIVTAVSFGTFRRARQLFAFARVSRESNQRRVGFSGHRVL